MADQAFGRAAGAALVSGNTITVLRDGRENYPVWEAAIRNARHTIHLEMYIVHRDAVGRRFVDLLAAKAREGVAVRVIYDWFGCGLGPALGLFAPLRHAGGQARVFNPPTLAVMFGWLRRNHRKLLVVDGEVAFIGGLCIGQAWEGTSRAAPWRDTAVELRGPSVSDAERAFAESWALVGGGELPEPVLPAPIGDVRLRLIPTEPFTASMLRMDLLVAAMARHRLWIADAYFIGHGPFADALARAARDGVDVRLLLPMGSDVGWTVPVSRTLYRSLLHSGVRIFEWTESMMHAKTAVADSQWARIGSTNLNINSWLGNWEMDVAINDEHVAAVMEAHFEADLARATEITVTPRGRLLATPTAPRSLRARRLGRRSARRAVREVTGVARSVGAALTASRPLEDFEVGPLVVLGIVGALGAAAILWRPGLIAWPIAALLVVAAFNLFTEAWRAWVRE